MFERALPSKAEKPSDENLARYHLYREPVAAEATWLANRTGWLLTANAFMASAYAILADKASNAKLQGAGPIEMRRLLPSGAVAVNVGTLLMMLAAEWVTLKRRREYGKPHDYPGVPHLLGSAVAHTVGWLVPVLLAAMLAYGWVRVAVA